MSNKSNILMNNNGSILKQTTEKTSNLPHLITRRSFTAAAAMSFIVPPSLAFSQPKFPGFAFYDLDSSEPQGWADALRLDPDQFAPGQFEWWYTDGHLSNGITFVASWHLEIDPSGALKPYITVNFANKGKVLQDHKVYFNAADAHFGQQRCDVAIEKHFIRSIDGLKSYELYIDSESNGGYGLHLQLDRNVPSYRPGPDDGTNPAGPYFQWVCAVPNGSLQGTVTVNNETNDVTGSGYHDHNWGNVPMSALVKDWHWGRGEAGGYTAVAASVRLNNGVVLQNVYVADNTGIIIAAIGPAIGFQELATTAQPDTSKIIGSDVLFDMAGQGSVRFLGKKAISSFIFDSDPKHHWWYTRFDTDLKLEILQGNGNIAAEGHAVLEHMDFRGQKVAG